MYHLGSALQEDVDKFQATLPKTLTLKPAVQCRDLGGYYEYSYNQWSFKSKINCREHLIKWFLEVNLQKQEIRFQMYVLGNISMTLHNMFQLQSSCYVLKPTFKIVPLIPEEIQQHCKATYGLQQVVGYEEDRIVWLAGLQEILSNLRGNV